MPCKCIIPEQKSDRYVQDILILKLNQMKKIEKAISKFVATSIEEYALAKGITGVETFDYFKRYGVIQYLIECYNPLNTLGDVFLIEDIDEYVSNEKSTEENEVISR